MRRTTKQLKELFEKSIKTATNLYFTPSGANSTRDGYVAGIYSLYEQMFGTWPYDFPICQFLQPVGFDKFTDQDYAFAKQYLYGYDKYHKVDFVETLYKIKELNEGYCYPVSFGGINMIILDNYIVFWNQETSFIVLCPEYRTVEEHIDIKTDKIHPLNIMFCGDVWGEGEDKFRINDYMQYTKVKKQKDLPRYDYLIHGSQGFETCEMTLQDKVDIDIQSNYNDDLPYQETVDFLKQKNTSGLVVWSSIPGCGKSFLIKHLITKMKNHDFLFVNESCLAYLTDASFVKLLLNYKDAIIILEDCEGVLKERQGSNGMLSTLLNLSSGIIGDSFNLKFICTFNAKVSDIDPALLRKGRMKVRYEFAKLTPEKTFALGKKLGKNIPEGESLTLADIYNYEEKNNFSETRKKTIGFNKA